MTYVTRPLSKTPENIDFYNVYNDTRYKLAPARCINACFQTKVRASHAERAKVSRDSLYRAITRSPQ